MTREEKIRDAIAGLNVARAMLIDSSVDLERAKNKHASVLREFEQHRDVLARAALALGPAPKGEQ